MYLWFVAHHFIRPTQTDHNMSIHRRQASQLPIWNFVQISEICFSRAFVMWIGKRNTNAVLYRPNFRSGERQTSRAFGEKDETPRHPAKGTPAVYFVSHRAVCILNKLYDDVKLTGGMRVRADVFFLRWVAALFLSVSHFWMWDARLREKMYPPDFSAAVPIQSSVYHRPSSSS